MTDFTLDEIRAYYACRVRDLGQTSAKMWRGKCPVHHGSGDNFAVDSTTGLAHCHSECGKGWDILGLEMELLGIEFPLAKDAVYALIGRPKQTYADRDIVATFDYTDEHGTLLYQVVRRYPKKFAQRRPDGHGGWIWNLESIDRVPFNLSAVLLAKNVIICEGEKDVLTLKRNGIVATCNSEGAGNWKSELARHFAGKGIVLIPDNDEPGRAHVLKVAASLHGIAATIKILELPSLKAKGDVTDWFAAGGSADQLRTLGKTAQVYTPGFAFVLAVPSEEDKWVYDPSAVVKEAGGLDRFWNLAAEEGIPTPYAQLTEDMSGGLRKGESYIIAGMRGSGKTSLMLQFVSKALMQGIGVLLFSLEMGQRDVLRRLISIRSKINLAQLRILQKQRISGTITTQDISLLIALERRLKSVTRAIDNMPLLVHQKPVVTPAYLVSETHRLNERHRIGLVCVDHMQLMSSDGNEKKEYEKFTAISRAIKGQVVRELNIPGLIVSQVSRSNSMDKRTELEITDCRGSGALEEDTAAVILLYHDGEDLKRARESGRLGSGPIKAWLKLGKNRFGQCPTYLELQHFKGFTMFDSGDERDFISETHFDTEALNRAEGRV